MGFVPKRNHFLSGEMGSVKNTSKKTLIVVIQSVVCHFFWTPLIAGQMLVAFKKSGTPLLKASGGVRWRWGTTTTWVPRDLLGQIQWWRSDNPKQQHSHWIRTLTPPSPLSLNSPHGLICILSPLSFAGLSRPASSSPPSPSFVARSPVSTMTSRPARPHQL
jgi:hypothetical protein